MRQGVSLIELMVGIAILGIILTGVTGIFRSSFNSYSYTSEEVFNNQQGRNALYHIADEIRNAEAITSPPADHLQYDTFIYTAKNKSTGIIEARKIYLGSNSDAKTIVLETNGMIIERIAIHRTEDIKFSRIAIGNGKSQIKVDLTLHNDRDTQHKSPSLVLSQMITTLNSIP